MALLRIQHIPMFFTVSPITNNTKLKTQISCSNKNNNEVSLASEFAEKVSIMNARAAQAEQVMTKSRKILFKEFCHYLHLNEQEAKQKWNNIDEDEKRVLIHGFVGELSEFFQPLSAKYTKELVEEYLLKENLPLKSPPPPPPPLFPFDSIIGFP
ncbi:uncharacterized protein LOC131645051 [Vicia villosa]|uniref:uncharacterized protein LOC131645051 n=1 Tax=Vicia villosa TaxID=3911 RepID=UPI00273C86E4|nr:uncharacterized protein LOC131645051 [Vicia villosa]